MNKDTVQAAMFGAAKLIERHPERYAFGACEIPETRGDGARGCVLGWIGHFLDIREDDDVPRPTTLAEVEISGLERAGAAVMTALGIAHRPRAADFDFYKLMNEAAAALPVTRAREWMHEAADAAYCLRQVANLFEHAVVRLEKHNEDTNRVS